MNISSRDVFIILACVVIVIIIAFLGNESYNETREVIQEQFNEQQLMLAKQTAYGIEDFLDERVLLIEMLAIEGAEIDPDSFQSAFETMYENTGGFYGIEFIDSHGIVVNGYPVDETPVGYDLYAENRSRIFEFVRENKRTSITDPVPLFEGGMASFVWVPVYNEGEFRGAILAIIELSTITDRFISSIETDGSGDIYIIDDNGLVVYDNDESKIGKDYGVIFNCTEESCSSIMPLIEEQMGGGSGTINYQRGDEKEEQIISYTPVRCRNMMWSVGLHTSADEVDKIISSLYTRQAYLIITMAIIVLLGGIYYSLNFSRWNKILEDEVGRKTDDLKRSNKKLEVANQKLRELDQMKSDFISTVSHDLKTPLSAMKTSAEMLACGDYNKDSEKELIGIICRNVDRQTRLVEDLLDISRIESGRMKLKLKELEINSVVRFSVDQIEQLVTNKGLFLTLDLPEESPMVLVDKDRLAQVFINLIENAIKFTNEGGITIKVEGLLEEVEVSMIDTGIGVPPNDLEKIFEKFYQAENAVAKTGSTGLGLSICKGIIEAHNGWIWAESKQGLGCKFVFRLKRL
ncbi:MAG: sensor histidine kinase [Halobacteriota archaeon]|nr:sensor histidine kinase [Halobacteriota archaeon]